MLTCPVQRLVRWGNMLTLLAFVVVETRALGNDVLLAVDEPILNNR